MSDDKARALDIKKKVESLGGQLIAVSKKFKADDIKKIWALGVTDFAENYVEEALEKMTFFSETQTATQTNDYGALKWHFIGKVQSNNINKMLDKFEVIHSLFKLKHIKKFNENSKTKQKILIQVRHKNDVRENGVYLKDLRALIKQMDELSMINLKGLMFMPPEDFSKEQLRESFKEIKQTFDSMSLNNKKDDWDMISMGMSSDYEIALEMGATHVRIGTAVFGARN